MESIRKGLRAGDVEKDSYGRLSCTECGEELQTENEPDEISTLKTCPSCGAEWKEVG